MKLKGKNLVVMSIYRKGIFDSDSFCYTCENCGRAIVNTAEVKDVDTGKIYTIGLDCKKTLIDKKHIEHLQKNYPEWEAKYKIKDYKRERIDLELVLRYLDNPERYEVTIDNAGTQYINVYDLTQDDFFGNKGKLIYSESTGYLFKIGLENILKSAVRKGIIK